MNNKMLIGGVIAVLGGAVLVLGAIVAFLLFAPDSVRAAVLSPGNASSSDGPSVIEAPGPLPPVGSPIVIDGAEEADGGHVLIHQGSQQGRPDDPPVVIQRSQCGDVSDGGDIDASGVTGRISCGESIVGYTRGGSDNFNTRFYEKHFCTPATTNHNGGDERIYRLSVPEGRFRPWVYLDTPCADLDLAVIQWSGESMPTEDSTVGPWCEMNVKDGNEREIVDVTSDRATEWIIVVEGKDDEEGPFGLSVVCMPW